MINFSIKNTENNIQSDINNLKKKVITALWKLVSDLTDIAEDTAQNTIFNSSQRGFTKRSGDFASEGLSRIQRTQKASGYSVSAFLWSRAGNLYENFKERKRVYLYRALKKYFEKDNQINSKIETAIKEIGE